jgi:hypothetical protein
MHNLVRTTFGKSFLSASLLLCALQACKQRTIDGNTQSVEKDDPLVKQIVATYKVMPYLGSPYYKFDWDDYAACLPKEAKLHLSALAARLNVNKYELFTVAVGEGLGFRFDNAYDEQAFLNDPVSGFGELGTDVFGSELSELRSAQLLPSDFKEIKGQQNFNVPGDFYLKDHERSEAADQGATVTVKSAEFRNLKAGLTGFSALYANRQRMFLSLASRLGYKNITADQKMYWNYYYYQNPGMAGNALRSRGIAVRFIGTADSPRPPGIPMKSLKRVATMRHVMGKRSLEIETPCRQPVFGNPGNSEGFQLAKSPNNKPSKPKFVKDIPTEIGQSDLCEGSKNEEAGLSSAAKVKSCQILRDWDAK